MALLELQLCKQTGGQSASEGTDGDAGLIGSTKMLRVRSAIKTLQEDSVRVASRSRGMLPARRGVATASIELQATSNTPNNTQAETESHV